MKKGIFVTFLLLSLLSFSNAAPVGESDLLNGEESTIDPFELDIDLDDVYKYAKEFAKYDEADDMLKDVVQELREEAVDIKTGDTEALNKDGDVADSIEETMMYLRTKYGNEDEVFEKTVDEQVGGDSNLSNEEVSEPVTKENAVEKEEDKEQEQEKDDSELINKEDVEQVRKENRIEKEHEEAKKEKTESEISEAEIPQIEDYKEAFTSEYVREHCTDKSFDGKIECVKKACKWDKAEKRYVCQIKKAETSYFADARNWLMDNFDLIPYSHFMESHSIPFRHEKWDFTNASVF